MNDQRIINLYENLNKGLKNENDKQALTRLLLSKQQEKNEKVINEQFKLIESLNLKCKKLENDLKRQSNNNQESNFYLNSRNQSISLLSFSLIKHIIQAIWFKLNLKIFQMKTIN